MTDTRPSENTDKPFAAVAEYGRTHLGWGRTETPADTEQDPIEDLIERAQNANDPSLGMVFAQLATVRAVQAQTEQARIANLIAYATHRIEHTDATGPHDVAPALRKMLGTIDVAIRIELDL